MARPYEAQPTEALHQIGARVALVTSRFHSELNQSMAASARRELTAAGVAEEDILTAMVPGSYELPLVARRFARRADIAGVLCFGVVIKGETSHDHHVATGAAMGIQQVMLETDKLGVLTTNTLEQARARALPPEEGGEHDKGRECAQALIQLLNTLNELESDEDPRPA